MNPICFELFGRPIFWYGVLVALGFLAAVATWSWLSNREGYAQGFGSELGFWVMLSGILGARLGYVLANLDYYQGQPAEIFRFDKGGLIFYGGFIGSAIGLYLFARVKKMTYVDVGDLTLTAVPLGHGLGRVGCFLNGCCFGTLHEGPLGVRFPAGSAASIQQVEEGLIPFADLASLPVHPVQLYEAGLNFALWGVLVWIFTRRRFPGQVAATYFLIYPVTRFLLEYLRGDARMVWAGITTAQAISVLLFVAGAVMFFLFRIRARRPA